MRPFAILFFLLCLFLPKTAISEPRLRIAAGTSLIADIVRDITDDTVEIHTIVAPSSCPGHSDTSPKTLLFINQADGLLIHSWQQDLGNVRGILNAVQESKDLVHVIDVHGDWLIPSLQRQATERISAVLETLDPPRRGYYILRSRQRIAHVKAAEAHLIQRLSSVRQLKPLAISTERQKGFLEWAGFRVLATYGRPEELTPSVLQDLIKKGKAEKAKLVVDNLQSGANAGKALSREIGAGHVALSSFPGAYDGKASWLDTVSKSVDLLISASELKE